VYKPIGNGSPIILSVGIKLNSVESVTTVIVSAAYATSKGK